MCIHTPLAAASKQSDRDRALCEIAEKEERRRISKAELSERELAERQAILDNLGMSLEEAVAEGNRLWKEANDLGGA